MNITNSNINNSSNNNNNSEPSFHLRFLGEQVLHSSYSSACYGWLAHKLASFSETDNAVVVKLEDEGLVLRKLDTSNVITRLPFVSNCQCFIHNRELGLFSVVGHDSEAREHHRLLVFRSPSIDIIKEFSSCLRKSVLSSAFRRTNSAKSEKSACHIANFFEVFYLGRARFTQFSKPMTPEFVDKAVTKLSQDISIRSLTTSHTFPSTTAETEAEPEEPDRQRPRSHTVPNASIDLKDLLSAKCLSPSNPNRTLLIQLTESEVFLISPTSKTILLRVPFSDITAGCQGLENSQCFAFLTSASESLSTTETTDEKAKQLAASDASAVMCKNDGNNPSAQPFSPSQQSSSVTTTWAYIFLCSDEATSSNAVLSLRTCIRGPFTVTDNAFINGKTLKELPETANGVGGLKLQQQQQQRRDATTLMCDACPVRDFNAICSSLIDMPSDGDRLEFLSDYINSPEKSPLTSEDVVWVRQLLPKSASTEIALICDVVFALFQLTEFNRTSHVHVFESTNEKMKNAATAIEQLQKQKKYRIGRPMLSSISFSGPSSGTSGSSSVSFVDLIRDKISLKSKRRGSVTGSLFHAEDGVVPTSTTTTNCERPHIDLQQLVRKQSVISADSGASTCGSDIFREYVIVSDAEVARFPGVPDTAVGFRGGPLSAVHSVPQELHQFGGISETPKSSKYIAVPGSEPSMHRRRTLDPTSAASAASAVLRSSAIHATPLARFEQFPSTAPGFSYASRRHARLASIAIPSSPVAEHAVASARRRSIFEMVICPMAGSCTSLDSVATAALRPSKQHLSFKIDEASSPEERVKSPLDLFPSLIDPDQMAKQLDYEEPLGGCSDEVAKQWQELLNIKPTDAVKDAEKVEELLAAGVPKPLRGRIWSWLIKRELALSRRAESVPKVSQIEYAQLLSSLTPCNQQILMDLGRTFPNHSYFSQHFGAGQLALFNILKAYSLVDTEVGYCQGISFVAGVILMHSATEYDAFTLLLSLMYGFDLRSLYLPTMDGLHRCLYQLTRLLDSSLNSVFEHLTANDVMPVFFASPWFVTLFSSQFPLGFVVRVFDLVFYGNSEMLFRIIFSLFSINEPLLLSRTGGFEDVVDFLKTTFTEMSVIQLERLVAKVFNLDFSLELHRYAVEYDIYREEHDVSPARIIENVALNSVGVATSNGEITTAELAPEATTASDNTVVPILVSQKSVMENETARELAVARHKVIELRAERCDLLKTIEELQTKITQYEGEIMKLESVNESLRAENAILRTDNPTLVVTTVDNKSSRQSH